MGAALGYSTYLGGSAFDQGTAIAVDAAGNTYVAGSTFSANFPVTPGAYDTTYHSGNHVFVAKLSPGGSLDWATYLGGSVGEVPFGIAVDNSGNVYVTGQTASSDFPTTPNAFQTTNRGSLDGFVTKLNPTGTALVYSTYLGGSDADFGGFAIAVDASGNAYIGGSTRSSDFPTTPGAFQTTKPGLAGVNSATVTELNAMGSALIYSTYLGGTNSYVYNEQVSGIAVDAAGNAYVSGITAATDFPTTPGALQTSSPGLGNQPFVAKLNASGSGLVYSTYLGGSGSSSSGMGVGIAVDSSGDAYVTGSTQSSNFPTTPGAVQTTFGGGSYDAFVSKLNDTGTALVFSTYLGGSGNDYSSDFGSIALDGAGNVYVRGTTSSTDFPTANAVQATYGGGAFDAYVAKLNASGTALSYSTYLGGSGAEDQSPNGTGDLIAVDAAGNAYVTGITASTDFPTANAVQATNAGDSDAFVTKILSALVVTTASDDVSHSGTSLRDAISQANADAALGGSDTITFDTAQMGTDTITLSQGQLELKAGTGTTTISGASQITVSGGGSSRIFQVDSGAQAVISGLDIQDGSADFGAGIWNQGSLATENDTISGNSASQNGGGIFNDGGTLTVSNSIVADNTAGAGAQAGPAAPSSITEHSSSATAPCRTTKPGVTPGAAAAPSTSERERCPLTTAPCPATPPSTRRTAAAEL